MTPTVAGRPTRARPVSQATPSLLSEPGPAPLAWARRLHWASGDAVLVLLAYQWAVARAAGVAVPLAGYAFLAVGIWLGYTADRLADVARAPALARQTGRHAFHHRNRSLLVRIWAGTFLASWPLGILLLPQGTLRVGALVAAGAAAYVLWGSLAHPAVRRAFLRWKRWMTVLLLTLAGSWWLGLGAGWREPEVQLTVGVFALGAWWNLALLRRPGLLRRTAAPDEPPPHPASGFTAGFSGGLTATALTAGGLLLFLPLWIGALRPLPGVGLVVVGLGWLTWTETVSGTRPGNDDRLALLADLILCLGMLGLGLAAGWSPG